MREQRTVLLVLMCALVSGCTSGAGGSPVPVTSATAVIDSTPVGPGSGAPVPAVAAPLLDPDLPRLPDLEVPAWQPATRTEQLRTQITAALADGAGRPTLQQVVDAIDLTYQDMPGATPSDLPDGEGLGTSYVRALAAPVLGRLSSAQRAVLAEIDATEAEFVVGGGRSMRRVLTAPPAVEKAFQAAATTTLQAWRCYLKDFPIRTVSVRLQVGNLALQDPRTAMDAAPADDTSSRCDIRVFPGYWRRTPTEASMKFLFARELFHCRQMHWADLGDCRTG